MTLKTVKLASTKYYDTLPTSGNEHGRAFRDVELEQQVLQLTQNIGIGAQFGGKYFCHDIRVIRLPRHGIDRIVAFSHRLIASSSIAIDVLWCIGASCPVGLGVSCSADRQVKGKINKDGIFIEKLETDVSKYLPEVTDEHVSDSVVNININQPMDQLRQELSKYPVTTRYLPGLFDDIIDIALVMT